MRTLLWTITVIAVAAIAYFGRAWADDKGPNNSEKAAHTRIAILNLRYVLKNYDEYKKYQEETKKMAKENSKKAKEKNAKRSEQQIMIFYLDVIEAAQRYAAAHHFDLVLHYNDAITKEDFISPKNIARKVNENALMPVYCHPSMDISMELVKLLNKK